MVIVSKQNNIQLINNFLNQSIMKKSLFAILAAAACFASCSKVIDSPVVDNPITFDNYVGKDAQTRAAVIPSSVETVYVNAYLHKTTTTNGDGFRANFMSQQAVTKTAGADGTVSWTYTPIKYWPASDQAVDFVAWIPDASEAANSNITIVPNNDGQYTDVMEFVVNPDIKKQTDLLVADPRLDKNNAGDNEMINLHFKHLLSRIGFEIVATGVPGVADRTTIVTLNNITLKGVFANTGTVKMTQSPVVIDGEPAETSYTLTGAHFGWTNIDETNDFDETNIIREGTTRNLDDSYLMIIPTEAVPSMINVKYTVTTKDSDGNVSGDPIENETDFPLTGVQYQPGKAYKYIFYITMEGIRFDVVIDDWDEQLVQDLNPEDSEWATINLQTGSQGTAELFYKGTLQVGTEIYVTDTTENSPTKGKKVKVSAAVEGTLTKQIGKFPVGTVIKVSADGKVTEITTPSAN